MSSPTFTLIHEYGSDVYHIDLYRLDTQSKWPRSALRNCSIEAVVLVEWGERFPEVWPPDRWRSEYARLKIGREFTIGA